VVGALSSVSVHLFVCHQSIVANGWLTGTAVLAGIVLDVSHPSVGRHSEYLAAAVVNRHVATCMISLAHIRWLVTGIRVVCDNAVYVSKFSLPYLLYLCEG